MKLLFKKGRKYQGKHLGRGDIAEIDEATAMAYIYSGAAIEHDEKPKAKPKAKAKNANPI